MGYSQSRKKSDTLRQLHFHLCLSSGAEKDPNLAWLVAVQNRDGPQWLGGASAEDLMEPWAGGVLTGTGWSAGLGLSV